MKAITAYIQPFMMGKVTDALREQNINGVSVIQCEGFGRWIDGNNPHYEDPAAELGFAPKAKIEVVCRDDQMQKIVHIIRENAHTGRHGDGKIFVSNVTLAVDVRTGAEGEEILQS